VRSRLQCYGVALKKSNDTLLLLLNMPMSIQISVLQSYLIGYPKNAVHVRPQGKVQQTFLIVLVRTSWKMSCLSCAWILEQKCTLFSLVSCDSVLHVSPNVNFLAWFNSIKLSIVTTTVSLSVLYQSLHSTENCVTDFWPKQTLLILLQKKWPKRDVLPFEFCYGRNFTGRRQEACHQEKRLVI
jgi:hypothetical protein